MCSWAKECTGCEGYDLDDSSAWSGLEWWLDFGKVLGEADHMAAARRFFIESLDDVGRFREKYPDLPWGSDT